MSGDQPGLITSPTNRRVAQIRKLRSRKEREASGLFFVEGIRAVGEAVQLGAAIETLVVAPELLRSAFGRDLVAGREAAGVPVLRLSAEAFAAISGKDGPQGLAAVVRQQWEELPEGAAPGAGHGGHVPPLWIAVEAVQDPGNLGSILRTGDAVGTAGAILLGPATDPHDPACVRASMGAVFSQRLVRGDVDRFRAWARRHGLAVVGATGDAEHDYRAIDAPYRGPLVVLMGSEREGLSPAAREACDHRVRVPMTGRCDSLNLAVATAVVLYEVLARRQGRPAWPGPDAE